MSLQKLKDQKGFTIVELLIVIVVIGILAAITIVAYNGIQKRAGTSAAQSLATSIDKKLEAWNSVTGSYPTYCQFATNTTDATGTATGLGTAGCTAGATAGPLEAKLDNSSSVAATSASVTSSNGKTVVYLSNMSSTGARINYFNFSSGGSGALTTSSSDPASPTAGNP